MDIILFKNTTKKKTINKSTGLKKYPRLKHINLGCTHSDLCVHVHIHAIKKKIQSSTAGSMGLTLCIFGFKHVCLKALNQSFFPLAAALQKHFL